MARPYHAGHRVIETSRDDSPGRHTPRACSNRERAGPRAGAAGQAVHPAHRWGGAEMSDARGPAFRWLERGDGEPVVWLHGLMGRMDHWDAQLEGLAETCRSLALDLPIVDPALPATTIEALAAHVVRFLDALAIGPAVIAGNSLGGHVALEVALRWPDLVSGLVLAGSSGLFERGYARGVPHRPTPDYIRARLEEVVFDPALVTDAWVESVRAMVTARGPAHRILRFARAARRSSLEHRLAGVRAPALLVWDAGDRITPPEVARRFARLLPE